MDDDDHPGGTRPRILISDRQGLPVDAPALAALARETLIEEGLVDGELSLSFVEDTEIADLHERFMAETGPTDVLSFPLDDVDEDGTRILGDVIVAPAVA